MRRQTVIVCRFLISTKTTYQDWIVD
jgi:hypothetical protein